MAYPATLPALTNPTAADDLDTVNVEHDVQHANANDNIELIAIKLGVDNSAVATTIDYLVKHGKHPQDTTYSGILTPATLATSPNNYAPTGYELATVIRQDCTAARDITGIVPPSGEARYLIWINISGTFTQTLKNQNASSAAANRFALSASTDVVIPAGATALLWYDTVSTRWRVLGTGGSGTDLTAHLAAADPHPVYLLAAGDTATGQINVPLLPVASANATSKDYVDDLIGGLPAVPDISNTVMGIQHTGSWPARSTVTSDPNQRVEWKGPAASPPSIGGAGAVNGVDTFVAEP